MTKLFLKFTVSPSVIVCLCVLGVLLTMPLKNPLVHGEGPELGPQKARLLLAASEFRERITDAPPLSLTEPSKDAVNGTTETSHVPEPTKKDQALAPDEHPGETGPEESPGNARRTASESDSEKPPRSSPALVAPDHAHEDPLPENIEEMDQDRLLQETQFLVQVGAFKVRKHAQDVLAELKKAHASAGLVQVELESEQWFVVYADRFARLAPALERAEIFRMLEGPAVVVQITGSGYKLVLE